MTKEEARLFVMDAISIALKDSTLQQGFEIICKKNAELEKENKELKTVKIPQLERKIASIRGAHSVDCKKLNARTEQVERLKKENAELKDYNQFLSNLIQAERERQVQCDWIHLRKIAELEKENAELRKVNNKLTRKCDCLTECNDGLQDLLDNNIDVLEKLVQLQKENDKAKEIVANILTYFPNYKVETFDDMSLLNALAKAEQFLKEVSE